MSKRNGKKTTTVRYRNHNAPNKTTTSIDRELLKELHVFRAAFAEFHDIALPRVQDIVEDAIGRYIADRSYEMLQATTLRTDS